MWSVRAMWLTSCFSIDCLYCDGTSSCCWSCEHNTCLQHPPLLRHCWVGNTEKGWSVRGKGFIHQVQLWQEIAQEWVGELRWLGYIYNNSTPWVSFHPMDRGSANSRKLMLLFPYRNKRWERCSWMIMITVSLREQHRGVKWTTASANRGATSYIIAEGVNQ